MNPFNWNKIYDINRTSYSSSVQNWEIDLSSNNDYYRIYKYHTDYVFSGNYWIFDEIIIDGIDEDGNSWTNPHITENGVLGTKNQLTCWTNVEQSQGHSAGEMNAWCLFDGSYGNLWHHWFHSIQYSSSYFNGDIIFSLPKPICIKKLTIWDQWDGYDKYPNRNTKTGAIYGDLNNM